LNVIFDAFYELNGGGLTFLIISLVQCIQNGVEDDVPCDA